VAKLDDPPNPQGEFDDDRTAVVNLASLRGAAGLARDRHLLVRVRGNNLGQAVRLGAQPCTLGRHPDSEIWIGDDGVSRRHARIVENAAGHVLEDLASANGTFVNGVRVERHQLRDGDLIQLGPIVAFRYSVTDSEQELLLGRLHAASVTDSLTGAANRDHFDHMLSGELSYARRHHADLSLVLFDLDHFKSINDTYGHPCGDAVLVAVASAAREALRKEDVLARYGGEEFAVILRAIDLKGASALAERLRQLIEELRVQHCGHEVRVTASLGCASLVDAGDAGDARPEALIATADRRLYAAKEAGRNRVVAHG
jgi:diguanylate cyclase (GGDEF)-like protein